MRTTIRPEIGDGDHCIKQGFHQTVLLKSGPLHKTGVPSDCVAQINTTEKEVLLPALAGGGGEGTHPPRSAHTPRPPPPPPVPVQFWEGTDVVLEGFIFISEREVEENKM